MLPREEKEAQRKEGGLAPQGGRRAPREEGGLPTEEEGPAGRRGRFPREEEGPPGRRGGPQGGGGRAHQASLQLPQPLHGLGVVAWDLPHVVVLQGQQRLQHEADLRHGQEEPPFQKGGTGSPSAREGRGRPPACGRRRCRAALPRGRPPRAPSCPTGFRCPLPAPTSSHSWPFSFFNSQTGNNTVLREKLQEQQ